MSVQNVQAKHGQVQSKQRIGKAFNVLAEDPNADISALGLNEDEIMQAKVHASAYQANKFRATDLGQKIEDEKIARSHAAISPLRTEAQRSRPRPTGSGRRQQRSN